MGQTETITSAVGAWAMAAGLAVAANLITPAVAYAAAKGASACTRIAKADERLACYDLFYAANGSQAKAGTGKWRVRTLAANARKAGQVILGLRSAEVSSNAASPYGNLQIFATCRNGGAAVWINLGREIDNRSLHVPVVSRTETSERREPVWRLSNDRRSVGVFDNDEARRLLLSWRKNRDLTLLIAPTGSAAVRAPFRIEGLANALEPLARACRWPEAQTVMAKR